MSKLDQKLQLRNLGDSRKVQYKTLGYCGTQYVLASFPVKCQWRCSSSYEYSKTRPYLDQRKSELHNQDPWVSF